MFSTDFVDEIPSGKVILVFYLPKIESEVRMSPFTEFCQARTLFMTPFILLVTIFFFSDTARPSQRAAAATAASEDLHFWLEVIPKNQLSHYGFSGPDELKAAGLGDPIHVHMIHPNKILNFLGEDLSSMISRMDHDTWLFPVVVRNRYKCLLRVAEIDGNMKTIGIGSAGLARQLDAVLNEWSDLKAGPVKLVQIFQANSDFVVLERKSGRAKLIPLESAATMLQRQELLRIRGQKWGQILYEPQRVEDLIPALKENVVDALEE